MSLLNRKKVKAYALSIAKGRAHKFTRVGKSFYEHTEAQLKLFVRTYVSRLPSKGKTIL